MTITDDRLTGWLIFAACQPRGACIPDAVHARLVAKGWIDEESEITAAGKAVCDLNAEEWGIQEPWNAAEELDA